MFKDNRNTLKNRRNPKLSELHAIVFDLWNKYQRSNYFQADFGYRCNQKGNVAGTEGKDIELAVAIELGRTNVLPLARRLQKFSNLDYFELIEFFNKHVSYPTEVVYHKGCGVHVLKGDKERGRKDFQEDVESKLRKSGTLFSLSKVPSIDYDTVGIQIDKGNVTGLGFFDCDLVALPEGITDLTTLETLSLRKNSLHSLPEAIGNLHELKFLSFKKNNLEALPSSISELESLRYLILDDNKIHALPDNIGRLKKLKTLSMNKNQLRNIPLSIGELTDLEYLSLNSNYIAELPASLFSLENLRILDLRRNNIEDLPELIKNLKNLEYLLISHNNIKTLPVSNSTLEKLKELDIKANPISMPLVNINHFASRLKYIDIFQDTKIQDLSDKGNRRPDVLIIGYNDDKFETEKIISELEIQGISWILLSWKQISIPMSVIPRTCIVHSLPTFDKKDAVTYLFEFLNYLEVEGCKCFPSSRGFLQTSKGTSVLIARKAGIKVPAFIFGEDLGKIYDFITQYKKVVYKPFFGSQGIGIELFEESDKKSIIQLLVRREILFLQEFIENRDFDIRTIFINGEVKYQSIRENQADFRHNTTQGGVVYSPDEYHDRDPKILTYLRESATIAELISRNIDLEFFCIDTLPSLDGNVYLLEINDIFGFRGYKVNIEREIVKTVKKYLG